MKILEFQKKILSELSTMVRYGVTGLLNTGIFTLSAWLLHMSGWAYPAYTTLSYTIAIIFSFFMNYIFTFGKYRRTQTPQSSRDASLPRQSDRSLFPLRGIFIKFLLVSLSLLGCVQLIQYGLIEKIGLPEIIGVISGMIFYTGFGYLCNRLWVFKPIKQAQS